ncbi:MAG: hypothetical protein ACK5Z5_05355 [Neisseriaceae bacterium]
MTTSILYGSCLIEANLDKAQVKKEDLKTAIMMPSDWLNVNSIATYLLNDSLNEDDLDEIDQSSFCQSWIIILSEAKRVRLTDSFIVNYCRPLYCSVPQSVDEQQDFELALRDFRSKYPLGYLLNDVSEDQVIEINEFDMDKIQEHMIKCVTEQFYKLVNMQQGLGNTEQYLEDFKKEHLTPQLDGIEDKMKIFKERYYRGDFKNTFNYMQKMRQNFNYFGPIFEEFEGELVYTKNFLISWQNYYNTQMRRSDEEKLK